MTTILAMGTNSKLSGMHTFPLSVHKLTTSAYFPNGNDGVERVNHTVAKILAIDLQRTPK